MESESRDCPTQPQYKDTQFFFIFYYCSILRVIKKPPQHYSKLQKNPRRKAIIFPHKIICFSIFVAHAYYSDSSFLLLKACPPPPYPLSLSLSLSLSPRRKQLSCQLPSERNSMLHKRVRMREERDPQGHQVDTIQGHPQMY